MRLLRRDEGLTLVELIVTVAILGIAFLAIVGGMTTSILASDIHRKESTAETVLRSYAEFLKKQPWPSPACPAAYPTAFPTPGFDPPAGYTPTVTEVEYWVSQPAPSPSPTISGHWDADPPGGTCAATDSGLQRLTLEVSSSDGRAAETVQMIKRKL
jgi:prepilin-type N-terminal cleavage/methylation domain-containing protein